MTVVPDPRITLLDGFSLCLGSPGSRLLLDDVPHGVQRLMAHLSLTARPPRSAVAGHLWPDVPEDHAHGSLRSALWRLQKLAPGLVEATGGALSLAAQVRVDVRELGEWARRVRDTPGPASPTSRSRTSASAESCCRAGTTAGSCSNGNGCATCACTPWSW